MPPTAYLTQAQLERLARCAGSVLGIVNLWRYDTTRPDDAARVAVDNHGDRFELAGDGTTHPLPDLPIDWQLWVPATRLATVAAWMRTRYDGEVMLTADEFQHRRAGTCLWQQP